MTKKNILHVVEVFVIGYIGAVLCSELSSIKSIPFLPAKHGIHEDSASNWYRLVRETPSRDVSDETTSRGMAAGIHPPKHIMKLMKKLTQDQDLLKGRGNTVRSILPRLGYTCNELMYVFKLRPHETEDLNFSELHYFASGKSKVIGANLIIGIQLHLIVHTPPTCRLIGALQQHSAGRGWQTTDVTPHLGHAINSSKSTSSQTTIGVSFKINASYATPRDRDMMERVISNHARPFLLMYAQGDESSDNNSVFPWAGEGAKQMRQGSIEHTRHARSIGTETHPIISNEFPEGGITNLAHQATFQHFTEQDSKRRKAKKRTSKKRKDGSKRHGKAQLLDQSSSTVDDDVNTVVQTNEDMNTVVAAIRKGGVCSRHPMFVDFNTINWDRYVIAPLGFDAFYCAGACSFPLSKTASPSNHAAIQSVMSVAGAQEIPSPCCVPQSMSSLSILFFDEDGNVALKTYQDMVVESCGCR